MERILDVRVVGAEAAAAKASEAEIAALQKAAAKGDDDGSLRRHSDAGDERAAAVAAALAAAAGAAAGGPKEYYVKWKERSYLHCSWVHEVQFERAAKLGLVYLRTRLRKFHAERDALAAAAAAASAAAEEEGEDGGFKAFVDEGLVHGVHANWLQVRLWGFGLHIRSGG